MTYLTNYNHCTNRIVHFYDMHLLILKVNYKYHFLNAIFNKAQANTTVILSNISEKENTRSGLLYIM